MTTDASEISLHKKVDALNSEAWLVRVSDSAKAFALSGEAVMLSRETGYKKGLAESLRTYGFAHIRLAKHKEATELLTEALRLFEELKDAEGMSDVLEYFGIVSRSSGNFDASLAYLYKSLELRQPAANSEGESLTCYHLGVTYKYMGNYDRALHYLLKCLSIAREKQFRVSEAYAMNLIGQIYFETADYQQALNYYQQSLVIRRESGDQWGEAGCLDNIGYTYYKLGDLEKAVQYCSESLAICRDNGDKKGQGNALFHLSEIGRLLAENEKAKEAALESLQIRQEIDDKKGQAEVLLLMADGDTVADSMLVQERLNEALLLANAIGAKDLLAKVHYQYYKQYKNEGNYEKALHSFETYSQLEKDLHKDAVAEKVINLQIAHRAEQANKEAENFRLRNSELAALYDELKKQKEETEQQKLVAEESLHQLKEMQAQLVQKEKMASLGELTAGIAHEIQNPLNFVNNFSEVSLELVEEIKESTRLGKADEAAALLVDLQSNLSRISNHGKRADAIVKAMLQHSRSGTGKKEPANINALAEEYLRLSFHGMRAKDKTFHAQYAADLDSAVGDIVINVQDIGRVLLNLYNNAFYSVFKKAQQQSDGYLPMVTVSTRNMGNHVALTIKDNGLGIPEKIRSKIFQPFFTTKPAGDGTGLGLSLSYEIITKEHRGEMRLESVEGEYAAFAIHLPFGQKN